MKNNNNTNTKCSCTIFLAQILLVGPWPKAQPTINICREWVKELSLSELIRSNAWIILLLKRKTQGWSSTIWFYSFLFWIQFFVPFYEGLPYIIYFLSSHLNLTLVDHLSIYFSTCPISRPHHSLCELQRPRWYCSGVFSSLMRPRGWLGRN